MAKLFQKKLEDFVCERCSYLVKGNGYTNHCSKCLRSKHVDINPGDRAEQCQGIMNPVFVEKVGKDFFITHKCEKCGKERRNRAVKGDDFDVLVEISQK